MTLFTTVLAEATELTTALEGLPAEEAAAAVGITSVLGIAWTILQIIADWKIFTKAGEAGWKSIIPILNTYVEYDICWKGVYGLLFLVTSVVFSVMSPGEGAPTWKIIVACVCGIIAVVLHFMQSIKLSKAFGHGIGLGLVLFILGPIGRIVLGFGGSVYEGRPD